MTRASVAGMHLIAILLGGRMAGAQASLPALRVGDTVRASLSDADPQLRDGKHFRAYRLDATRGHRYAVSLTSTEFDTYLKLGRPAGPIIDFFESDDDGGAGTDSFLRFRSDTTGPFVVLAAAESRLGTYELTVRDLGAGRPLAVRPIAIGDSVSGQLDSASASFETTSLVYDVYSFRARAGQALTARVSAGRTDMTVAVGRITEAGFRILADSELPGDSAAASERRGYGRRAVGDRTVRITLPADGEYALGVLTDLPDSAVRYRLRLTDGATAPAALVARGVLRAGVDATGHLDASLDGSPSDDRQRPFQEWSYSARKGERLTITMRSSDFDSYLVVGRHDGDVFRDLERDDDGGGGNDARVGFVVPESGEYTVRAEAFGKRDGAYTLRVDSRPSVAHSAQRATIVAGRTVTGTLEESDAAADDGSPFDDWIYSSAMPGERLTITMRSSEFDTFLAVGYMERGEFVQFSSNDDATDDVAEGSGSQRVSRVVVVVPKAGPLVIRTNTFGPDQHGRYTLLVERAARLAAGGPSGR